MMASSTSSASPSAISLASSAAASNSPCAACKFLRRKCLPECVFAPYFPPDQPQKFAHVHKVFGASNVTKLLNELSPYQREDAVNSLAYEAEMRLRDPVYGCVGVISLLQHQLRQLQMDLTCAKSELSKYQQQASTTATLGAISGGGGGGIANGLLLNVNHSIGAGNGGAFGREQLIFNGAAASPVAARDNGHAAQLLMRGAYDAEMAAARFGVHGVYDAAGFMAASAAGVGSFGFPFGKTRAGGCDERQVIGPS